MPSTIPPSSSSSTGALFKHLMMIYDGQLAQVNGCRSKDGVKSYVLDFVSKAIPGERIGFLLWNDAGDGMCHVLCRCDECYDFDLSRSIAEAKDCVDIGLDGGFGALVRSGFFVHQSVSELVRLEHYLCLLRKWFRTNAAPGGKFGEWRPEQVGHFLEVLDYAIEEVSTVLNYRMTETLVSTGRPARLAGVLIYSVNSEGRVPGLEVEKAPAHLRNFLSSMILMKAPSFYGWRCDAVICANPEFEDECRRAMVFYSKGKGKPLAVMLLNDGGEFFHDPDDGPYEPSEGQKDGDAAGEISVGGQVARLFRLTANVRYAVVASEFHDGLRYYCVRNDDGNEAWLAADRIGDFY